MTHSLQCIEEKWDYVGFFLKGGWVTIHNWGLGGLANWHKLTFLIVKNGKSGQTSKIESCNVFFSVVRHSLCHRFDKLVCLRQYHPIWEFPLTLEPLTNFSVRQSETIIVWEESLPAKVVIVVSEIDSISFVIIVWTDFLIVESSVCWEILSSFEKLTLLQGSNI